MFYMFPTLTFYSLSTSVDLYNNHKSIQIYVVIDYCGISEEYQTAEACILPESISVVV